ncbi:MAG: hypothetical protein ABI386_01030 [Rhodanobacter sp.]
MTQIFWYDWAGYLGVVLVLLAYLLLQARLLPSDGLIYQLMNLLSALGLILSLLFGSINWPAFLMEVAWLLISIYGIVRGWRLRQERSTRI